MGAALALAGLAFVLGGCAGIPDGTVKKVAVGRATVQAEGTGIVKANVQTTTVRTKCGSCGFVTPDMVVGTPLAGRPIVIDWVCPRCGHKQKITIQVGG